MNTYIVIPENITPNGDISHYGIVGFDVEAATPELAAEQVRIDNPRLRKERLAVIPAWFFREYDPERGE